MAQQVIQGTKDLARQIKQRRNELGLTIEEAATKAGVGTKTWCRYEAGESIRKDKCKGICKALNWKGLPNQDHRDEDVALINKYRNHNAWSTFLEENYGVRAALSFAMGSDILYDHISDDMEELASMPIGTHIGQLNVSWLCESLPKQFLMKYNYEFLYKMKCTLQMMRLRARYGNEMVAHSVFEELIIYICNEEAAVLLELTGAMDELEIRDNTGDSEEWLYDLFEDMDIVSFLYSDVYIDNNHTYHFDNWDHQQFFI